MLDKVATRLLATNALLTAAILLTFSTSVFGSVVGRLDTEVRHRLWDLSDAVINAYIAGSGQDEAENPGSIERILKSSAPEEDESVSTGEVLEWFSSAPNLVASSGTLKLTIPFDKDAEFQEQSDEHALALTRKVTKKGHLLGYLRTAVSLEDEDDFKNQLLTSLGICSLIALSLSSLAVLILVRQFLKPMAENLKRLSQFTSDVSHELRSPLTAVKSNASVALRHSEGMRPGDRDKFQKILDAANQMIKTTSDLLSLAQAQEKVIFTELPSVDFSQLVEEVCKYQEPHAVARGLTFKYQIPPALLVRGRSADLKRVLTNLVENAIQYTEAGSITIVVEQHRSRVQVEVRDTGIGIKEGDETLVFDRFWRSDKARSHRSGGNGLGLAIAREIVEAHGGSIGVHSNAESKGSVFHFVLPAFKAVSLTPSSETDLTSSSGSGSGSASPSVSDSASPSVSDSAPLTSSDDDNAEKSERQ